MKFNRRVFMQTTTAALALEALTSGTGLLLAYDTTKVKFNYRFAESNNVTLGGLFGGAYQKGLARLDQDPINCDFVLADVNFNQKRRFTNFSGDISGRYIEVCSLTSKKENPSPAPLKDVLDKIIQYQKKDGHYGVDVDWNAPIDFGTMTDRSAETPILWGNGRIFLGLLAAYERFDNKEALASAERMADFYINIVIPRFCDPKRKEEYSRTTKGYAAAYVTCVFHGIEGLVRCYRLTGKKKYLDAAIYMADFHEPFDILPVGHSHGSISTHEALVMLYEETADRKYLDRVIARWETVVKEGYVNPCGSVLEKFFVSGHPLDEGCSESDWLRLNLMLWRNTGNTRYLDFAERLLYNGYLANQWPSGGFGHRLLGVDDKGPYSWKERRAESYWCCSYHGPLGYYEFKEFLAVCRKANDPKDEAVLYNFPIDFKTPLLCAGKDWTIESSVQPGSDSVPVKTFVTLACSDLKAKTNFAVRVPDWASGLSIFCAGKKIAGSVKKGYWNSSEKIAAGSKLEIAYIGAPYFEDRRFAKMPIPKQSGKLQEAVLRFGPNVLVAKDSDGQKIENLALTVTKGKVEIPTSLTCFAKMDDAGRAACHTFVFNVDLTCK